MRWSPRIKKNIIGGKGAEEVKRGRRQRSWETAGFMNGIITPFARF